MLCLSLGPVCSLCALYSSVLAGITPSDHPSPSSMPGPSRLTISVELDSIVLLSTLVMPGTGSGDGTGTCSGDGTGLADRAARFCAVATAGQAGLMPGDESGDLRMEPPEVSTVTVQVRAPRLRAAGTPSAARTSCVGAKKSAVSGRAGAPARV